MTFSKEPGESINSDLKAFQLDHAPQFDIVQRNVAAFDRMMDRSDIEVLRHFSKKSLALLDKEKIPHGPKVLSLCRSDSVEPENVIGVEQTETRESNRGEWCLRFSFDLVEISTYFTLIIRNTPTLSP